MDSKSALRTRLENLSPEQRAALLQQISRARQQQGQQHESRPSAGSRYPLSLAQRRLWILSQLGSEANAAYNIASAFCFDKGLDPERLSRAWRQLLGGHEVLRSNFAQEGDELFQTPRNAAEWVMHKHKLRSDQDVEAQLLDLASTEAAKPFDLLQDWLLKVIYCATDKGQAGLIVVIHHSVCDGLSITSMIQELVQYYEAIVDSSTTASAEVNAGLPALQYRDYVEYEARADTSKARAYWKDIFASAPETLDALLDLPRPVLKDFRGSSVAMTLATPDASAFEAFCHAHNATLYMGLVALVQLLLARFANVGEVTLGTPVAGRPGAQFDKVVGPFVNTVALRQTVDCQQTFPKLLLQVRRRVLEGFQHQGLAFDELVTELGFAKDPSRSPLYDAMLGLTFADEMALSFRDGAGAADIAGRALRVHQAFSKVDLTFHFEKDSDGSLRLDLEYATGVLLEATVRRLCDAWRLLAIALPRQPELALGELALQSEDDRRRLLEQVNATARPYPQQSSLVELFRTTVQQCPDAIAVHAGDVQLSYRILDELSDQLARSLLSHPAHKSGCRIALMLDKDERALIVILAILKSRGVYVPLAANTPRERVSQVLAAGEVRLLLVEASRIVELQELDVALIDTDALITAISQGSGNVLPSRKSAAEDTTATTLYPAYLMFTSGSTGKPKGTLIDQRSVLRLVCNTDYHQVRANERVLLTGSLAFDAATFEIWGPLLNGGCVCIPPGTTLLEVHEFQALVEHYQVDTAFLTTGLFNQIVNQIVDNNAPAFTRLQTVLTGGEKISVEHIRRLMQARPDLKLLHVYGPTENTTFSTWHHISADDLALATIPIGRPVANSRIYLLDQNLQPVPIGVPGEIYCGGDGIALGYVEQRDEGRSGQPAAFLANPFLPSGTDRLYRTGDLAKWNHKCELVFLGRNDRQVKIRGFRVELGEVEYYLRTLPGVMDAFVQARGPAGSSELVAWLVAPAGSGTTVGAVRDALKDSMPNYMLPAKIVCMERFPLNASGKVDVGALPLPENMDSAPAGLSQGLLHGKAEQNLARLYAVVLGLTGSAALGIHRDDNFFSLGGDSIRAIQLVSLARSDGYHFTLKDIFASETLAGLAAAATVTPMAVSEVALRSGPLSPTQLWWLEQCGAPANHFNLSSVFRVDAPIDMDALRVALDELLELHPALRLTLDGLSCGTGAHQQSIRDTGRYVLRDFEARQSRQQCWQELQQAIDLQAGILLAVGVARAVGASYLAVVVHHLAADEVSGRLFAENLERLYQRHYHQRHLAPQHCDMDSAVQHVLQEPVREALGLINWAAQLKATVECGQMDRDLGYWQDVVVHGRQILQRQQDLFTSASAVRDVAVRTLSHRETRELLYNGSALLRMTPQEILLAAFIRAWQCTLNHADCLLSLEGHGREPFDGLGDCSSTMGWFTSLYPFAITGIDAQQLDLYRKVKDSFRRLPAKGFTYLPLRYYQGDEARESLTLRPQLSFNYLGETVDDHGVWLQAANEPAGTNHGATVTEPFKLDVLARIADGQFELTLRGHNPRHTLGLEELAGAWLAELGTLAVRLQDIAAGHAEDQCLLSLSDSLVPFASLAELDATLAALRLSAAVVEEILPLTGMQAGMWLHCATHPTAYQDQVALRLFQPLEEERFAAAVKALVAETQALRTGFAQTPRGELLQIVFRERTENYQYLDQNLGVTTWSAKGEGDLTLLRASLRDRRRDLLRDPLFSLTLVRLDDACFELIIDFHHMALDGWTSALLLQRLEALYFGEATGGDRNAASGMRAYFEWLGRHAPEQARDYWHRLLGDYQSRSDVPAHLPRNLASDSAPLFVETRTGAALHGTLLSWCEQQGLTLNAVVQTLWGVFLSRLTGSDDLVFGATVSGRGSDLAGVGDIAGMLINTLPVRIRARDAASFAELAGETAQQFAESMSFGHLTLAEIQTLTPARAGLVTHALVFENYPAADAAVARWQWQPQEIFDPMHFEFGLIVAPLANDLSFRFVADGSLYLQDRLEKMGVDLCELLAALLDAHQPLDVLARGIAAGWTLSANFTADSLVGMLQYHEYIGGSSGAVTLLPYDQIVQELINPGSRLRRLQPQQHVVMWRPVMGENGKVVVSDAYEQLAELAAGLAAYAGACPGSRLYFVPCPWLDCNPQDRGSPDRGPQDGDWTLYGEFAAYMKEALADLHGSPMNAEVLTLENLVETYGLQQPCHPPQLIFGDIPYTEEFFAAVANLLARRRDLHNRKPIKVYVVDADDTLWGGIVGEDGVHGVRLDAAHVCLQQTLLNARAAGALICLATKNNEEDVRAVFDQREMPLRWTQLTRVCAGWRPKSESILALAEELSLGLDSFVFIDDSPLECEQVLATCPGVLAIQLPATQDREAFLKHLWLLDVRVATREDAARAQMYAEELQRANAKKATGTYAEFLASLDIRIDMRTVERGDLQRTAQLSQRTNQFNTTGIRYSEVEIASLLQNSDTDIRCVSVADKYGEYGLTGSIFIRRSAEAWTMFGFMLSCRVLGRGVEHTIMRRLAQEAALNGVGELRVDFVKLTRNAPALQFLQSIAFVPETARRSDAAWQFCLPVATAEHWQPGSVDNPAAHEESATKQDDSRSVNPREETTQVFAADATPLSARMSRYYHRLASTLNSGTKLLYELQRQDVIQKTGAAARHSASKTLPCTPTELTLASFFTELLGQPEIFREDSFHDLGGHSLQVMMLFSRIAARYGLTLDFRDLQANPMLADLAARIDATAPDVDACLAGAPVLRVLPQADSYPVSPGQSRLWMVEQLRAAGPSPFHMHATLTVDGSIDRRALDLALHALLLRHEALRTCFRDDAQGRIRQVVVPVAALPLSSQSARVHWLADVLDDAELAARAQEHSSQAFDLTRAPLVRIAAAELLSGSSALFITMHHIISDGWSVGIISRELTQLYKEFSEGRRDTQEDWVSQDRLQFRDFASWQVEWLASEAGARAAQFWREHFAHPVEALQLPAAAPRPALMQSAGAAVHMDIEAAVWTGFTRHLSSLGITDFTGLFAALQLVLGRLSGQQNFCIGTAVAGRQHQQLESVIGFFVNVLPLRATLKLDDSVGAFLSGVAAEVNDCLSHQGVPFDSIVSSLDLLRDPGRTPLFDVLLVLQNTAVEDIRFGAHVAQVHPVASTTSQYDLTLSAFPLVDGSLKLLAEYDSVIYAPTNIELILRCLGRTLENLADSPTATLANIPWVDESDIARVEAFESAPLDCGRRDGKQQWLPDIFRRSVAKAGGRISDAENDWSYLELEREMQRIAGLLRGVWLEVEPPVSKQLHVGVIGSRSVRSIAAMLGAMQGGGVYIPLDLSNPVDRLQLIIDEGAVDVLLSTDEKGAVLAADLQQGKQGLHHVRYTEAVSNVDLPRLHNLPVDSSAIAYMIFTSGSTGKPKGVQISHAAFSAMISQQIPAFDVQADDVCAQFAALSFDASLSEVFLALGTGASLAIAPDEVRSDIDAFIHWLEVNAITVITLPPVFLRALNKRPLGKLRVLVTAGEAAIAEDLRHYAESLHVLNAYGPTETSVCASVYTVSPRDTWPFGVPIGSPLPDVLLTVRDASGGRMPIGATGELYIGGATVGHGYYGAPELTERKFILLPADGQFVDAPSACPQQRRWYRSGDLVRWRDDGLLEFAGRMDAQVKVRGYRIEPGEIEHAARLIDGVSDALALVHPQLGLLLYCVTGQAQESRDALKSTIASALGRTLPRHMLPNAVLLLDAFPLSSAGKIQRSTLQTLASATGSHFVAPETSAEQVLAQTWRHVLNAERVGLHDDFFALGGDSIKALEVLSAIRALGFTCQLKDFFTSPLLMEMASVLAPWRVAEHHRDPLLGNIALLPVQNWFLSSRNNDVARHFHIVTELQLSSRVSATGSERLLREVLGVLTRNHDSLRARFYMQDGCWRQEIRETLDMNEVLVCYRRGSTVTTQADQSAIEALACRPFALETEPLFRCVLVQGPEGGSESLVLALHHLVADWVSLRILITDLNTLTRALLNDDADVARLSPPHVLNEVAEERSTELESAPAAAADAYRKAVATMDALAPNCGVHSELHILNLQISAVDLARLRDSLRRRSAAEHVQFRLQHLLLAAALSELGDLLPHDEIPLLVESHGRDGTLDLARQVAWLTRARLFNLDPQIFRGPDALLQASRILQVDGTLQLDVFACAAAEPASRGALPALMSFNFLGEFANSQHADDPFCLTRKVFDNAMAPTSPVDVPLHVECYVVDSVLEVQVAWSPGVFESEAMQACWERVRYRLASF